MQQETKELLEKHIANLKHPDGSKRAEAVEALGDLEEQAAPAVLALTESLSDVDVVVRRFAARALGKIGEVAQEGVQGLGKALSDRDSVVSSFAALSLGKIGESAQEAIPYLLESLENKDRNLRSVAVQTLGLIGPAAIEFYLKNLLKRERDSFVIEATNSAIIEIRKRFSDART